MSKEIEEIYRDYDNNSIEWMKKHNCMTTKQITIKLMELAQQQKIEQLEKEVESIKAQAKAMQDSLNDENEELHKEKEEIMQFIRDWYNSNSSDNELHERAREIFHK
ncbi:hypothetical protein [uncultured Lutibacter sp.]|uniref:hypothetical protein n=1 Tax=uncultured Lutibacter sp. TaxID=437739 RepID=UPI00260A71BC|nr:hypothetical protein [uncultured Lutibacter sp.]